MKKNVVGVFASSFEALRVINSMKSDGIDHNHIYVIANDDYETQMLEDKAGVAVDYSLYTEEDDRGFWDELKAFFKGTDAQYDKLSDYLLDLGMSKYDVEQYGVEVEAGKILVLVDSAYDDRTGIIPEDEPLHEHERYEQTDQNANGVDEQLNRAPQSLVENRDRMVREKEYEEDTNLFYEDKQ